MTTTKRQTVVWTGNSATRYPYEVYTLDTVWNDVGGNYIFTRQTPTGWVCIYIGQTQSFKDRIPNHEVWPCARRQGATHIHAHSNSNADARLREERDLKAAYSELC